MIHLQGLRCQGLVAHVEFGEIFILSSFPFHGVEAEKRRAAPGLEAEGQVGADRDGCTDTTNRGNEPRPAKHTQTPASPQMTQHMEYSWNIPPPFSTHHPLLTYSSSVKKQAAKET